MHEVTGDDVNCQLLLDWEIRSDAKNTGNMLRVYGSVFSKHTFDLCQLKHVPFFISLCFWAVGGASG